MGHILIRRSLILKAGPTSTARERIGTKFQVRPTGRFMTAQHFFRVFTAIGITTLTPIDYGWGWKTVNNRDLWTTCGSFRHTKWGTCTGVILCGILPV